MQYVVSSKWIGGGRARRVPKEELFVKWRIGSLEGYCVVMPIFMFYFRSLAASLVFLGLSGMERFV